MFLKSTSNFFQDFKANKALIWELGKKEFISNYTGSAFGLAWAFFEPFIYMAIMWFFFSFSLKFKPNSDVPYLPWLMSAMITWTFFSNCLAGSQNIFRSYSYMLKKWNFNMSILPFAMLISNFIIHLVFFILFIVLLFLNKIPFQWLWFQVLYYWLAFSVFMIGFSWVAASISLFFKDLKNIISIILQFGFWVSPIFWEIETHSEKYRFLFKLNPVYHLISGYRDTFIYNRPFWSDLFSFCYFWLMSIGLLILGFFTYKRLRPYFGDVI